MVSLTLITLHPPDGPWHEIQLISIQLPSISFKSFGCIAFFASFFFVCLSIFEQPSIPPAFG